MSDFFKVGRLAEFPDGRGRAVLLAGHRIAIFRIGADVRALSDKCPHMGASLAEGYLDGNQVICPWHGWVFDLDSGTSLFDANAHIPIYRVVVEDGQVYFEMEGDPAQVPIAPVRDGES